MNTKDLAAKLTGMEYPVRLDKQIEAEAKTAGIVVVFGASDDLMEFRGAIHDEVGAWGGSTVRVDADGLVPDIDTILEGGSSRTMKDDLRSAFRREGRGKIIQAMWDTEGYSWLYKTDIPHETFEVVEDGEPYCRGIVFALADVKA